MRRTFASLGFAVATLGLTAAAAADPLPPTPTITPRTTRHSRFGIGGLYATSQRDMSRDNQVGLAFDGSKGFVMSFGYPKESTFSFVIDLRFIFLEEGKASTSSADASYYDLGLGTRYTLPIGETVDFFGEGMLLGGTMNLSGGFGGDIVESQSDSGFGLLARGGVVLSATSRRSVTVSGSYSMTKLQNDLDGSDFWATFASLEVALELTL